MICNAIINKCDLKVDNDLENFYLLLEITAPDARFGLKTCEIPIFEIDLEYDIWNMKESKERSCELLPLLLLSIFKGDSFLDIKGQPCRIVVEEGLLKAIGNFLHNEWIDLDSFEPFSL